MILTSLIILAAIVWMIIIYNLLVQDRMRVLTSWSDIDVQLKRRHDLIPKLIDAVKQYASYESATLAAITALRTESESMDSISDKSRLESDLGARLHKLLAVAEDYPELKASQTFLDLQFNLTEVEKNIQYARRYYNGAVRNLNVRIASFPDMFVAKFLRFKPAQFFEMDDVDQENRPDA